MPQFPPMLASSRRHDIEFKIDSKARVEAFVESNSGAALVLLGTTFQYDANASFEDSSASPVGDITLIEDGHGEELHSIPCALDWRPRCRQQ